ncbi:hypothetical protein [Dehalogenimonas etheniformans]|uniref:Uncharacterized protein n=1 Tax=Dehalogenimonas etheniformans TaxID=1536648 RepID=A0A2P5P9Z9_9CHLR|nr:hypothetical protein [Dehalogenimonas etheniformans]PPD59138.1 hypothetical protein JP09_000210 [Dehalogenimonas etheniformans]QNT75818.1 hypothetical protein HX448_03500 [Dehalogenimonas etheniformans]
MAIDLIHALRLGQSRPKDQENAVKAYAQAICLSVALGGMLIFFSQMSDFGCQREGIVTLLGNFGVLFANLDSWSNFDLFGSQS